jgi:hypothetical protein
LPQRFVANPEAPLFGWKQRLFVPCRQFPFGGRLTFACARTAFGFGLDRSCKIGMKRRESAKVGYFQDQQC